MLEICIMPCSGQTIHTNNDSPNLSGNDRPSSDYWRLPYLGRIVWYRKLPFFINRFPKEEIRLSKKRKRRQRAWAVGSQKCIPIICISPPTFQERMVLFVDQLYDYQKCALTWISTFDDLFKTITSLLNLVIFGKLMQTEYNISLERLFLSIYVCYE